MLLDAQSISHGLEVWFARSVFDQLDQELDAGFGRLESGLGLFGFLETIVAHFTVSSSVDLWIKEWLCSYMACLFMPSMSATAWKSGFDEVCLISRIRNAVELMVPG